MGFLDILNGMQNGPRGQSDPNAKGGMSPITMAILALLAYKGIKHVTGGGQTPHRRKRQVFPAIVFPAIDCPATTTPSRRTPPMADLVADLATFWAVCSVDAAPRPAAAMSAEVSAVEALAVEGLATCSRADWAACSQVAPPAVF